MKIVNVSRLSIITALFLIMPALFAQSWQWAVPINSFPPLAPYYLTGSSVQDIAVDKFENIYIFGDFSDSLMLGNIKIKSGGLSDYYLAKLDASGNYLWAEDFPAAAFTDYGYSVTTDNVGDPYVLGYALNGVNYNGKPLVAPAGAPYVSLAKFNTNGEGIWAKYVENSEAGPGAITYSPAGFIYVGSDATLNKYATNGALIWSRLTATPGFNSFSYKDVCSDSAGNVYGTGDISGTITVGSVTLSTSATSDHDMFVVKYDPNGNVLWAKRGGRASTTSSADYGQGIGVDHSGNVYVAGEYRGIAGFDADTINANTAPNAIFLAKYKSNGDLDWVEGSNGLQGTGSAAFDLKVLATGDILLATSFSNKTTFAGTTFTIPNGSGDLLMMKLDPTGALLWSKRSDTPSPSMGSQRVDLNPAQTAAYVAGTFTIGGNFGASTLTQLTLTVDGFTAKLNLSTATAVEGDHSELLPGNFKLAQNYPNPFNPATTIGYSVPARSRVTLEIFNTLGETIRRLVDRDQIPGNYSTLWDGKDDRGAQVSSGIYFYRLKIDDVVATKKMILMK